MTTNAATEKGAFSSLVSFHFAPSAPLATKQRKSRKSAAGYESILPFLLFAVVPTKKGEKVGL